MVYSIARAGDRTYCMVKSDSDHSLVKFHLANKQMDPETSFYIAERAMKLYENKLIKHPKRSFSTIRFNYAGRHWKIVQPAESKWYEKILRYFRIIFFHKRAEGTPKEFKIESAWFGPLHCRSLTKQARLERKEWKKHIQGKQHLSNYKSLMNEITQTDPLSHIGRVTPEEYSQGVRGKIALDNVIWNSYEDPFSKLATWAFQRYENHATAKDGLKPKDCKCRLIQVDDTLLLVDAKSPLITKENLKAADLSYKAYLKSQFGDEKIAYINHLYDLKLEKSLKLTPEHIFRVNCGTMNVEIQDVNVGLQSIKDLKDKATLEDQDLPFTDFISDALPKGISAKLNSLMTNEESIPTVKDFLNWLESNESLDQWLQLFFPSEEEVNLASSGRKIYDVIQGYYTGGEWEEFKPWADQQELTQISYELIKCTSFKSYIEKLSHVVVKKHLARSHPTEHLRVGALVPAPPKNEGEAIRWYQVTSCSTNQYNYSYTLEPLAGSDLPAIKLMRNTASCGSAVFSTASIKNDLSLLGPPGYMGIQMMDKREKEFFDKRTIPLWVAYHHSAHQKLSSDQEQNQAIYDALKEANHALLREESKKYLPMSLKEILEKHDVILNELYFRNEKISGFKDKKLSPEFLPLFKNLVKTYVHISEKQAKALPQDKMDADINDLVQLLEKISPDEDEREQGLIKKLIKDLNTRGVHQKSTIAEFDAAVYQSLSLWNRKVKDGMESGENPLELLKAWSNELENYAISLGEDINSKLSQDLVFAGQSLGGASAQATLVFYLTKRGRVPLPDQTCSLVEFDAPAIKAKDNKLFKSFGNRNKDLLNELNIKFEIFRRQEAGDIVVAVGEEHLGATFSFDESQKLKEWLKFDAAVNERLKTAKCKEIARVAMVHETLFLEGKRVKGSISLKNKKIVVKTGKKDKDSDYVSIRYGTQIQGLFNAHGKKGEIVGKRGRKIYNNLHKNIWKISPLSFLNDAFRISTDSTATYIRRKLLANRKEDRQFAIEAQDKYGRVFVSLT